jgi:hypothetical protein
VYFHVVRVDGATWPVGVRGCRCGRIRESWAYRHRKGSVIVSTVEIRRIHTVRCPVR